MELIEIINHERSEFIRLKGYAPDTLYLPSDCEDYKGRRVLGMEIRIGYMLDKGQVIMCRFMDLKWPLMPEPNIDR